MMHYTKEDVLTFIKENGPVTSDEIVYHFEKDRIEDALNTAHTSILRGDLTQTKSSTRAALDRMTHSSAMLYTSDLVVENRVVCNASWEYTYRQ